jgi:hypothetical protein
MTYRECQHHTPTAYTHNQLSMHVFGSMRRGGDEFKIESWVVHEFTSTICWKWWKCSLLDENKAFKDNIHGIYNEIRIGSNVILRMIHPEAILLHEILLWVQKKVHIWNKMSKCSIHNLHYYAIMLYDKSQESKIITTVLASQKFYRIVVFQLFWRKEFSNLSG